MIVVSEDRYVPINPEYMVLQDADGFYYYVHRTFYEQSVIMEDRYGESTETLQKLIGGNSDFEAIDIYRKYVPRPLNIMGYFLALLQNDITDFVDIVGAMDTIASAINLRNLIKQPVSIRQQVSFGMSVENEYKDIWTLFFNTSCIPYAQLEGLLSGGGSYVSTATSSGYSPTFTADDTEEEDPLEKAYREALEGFAEAAEAMPEMEAPSDKKEDTESDEESGLGVLANARRRRRL